MKLIILSILFSVNVSAIENLIDKNNSSPFKSFVLVAVSKVESKMNPNAIGDDGRSIGLMQVQLNTARQFGYKGNKQGLLNPKTNLKYASLYMRYLLELTHDPLRSLEGYNKGEGAMLRRPFQGPWSKQKYVGKILKELGFDVFFEEIKEVSIIL